MVLFSVFLYIFKWKCYVHMCKLPADICDDIRSCEYSSCNIESSLNLQAKMKKKHEYPIERFDNKYYIQNYCFIFYSWWRLSTLFGQLMNNNL